MVTIFKMLGKADMFTLANAALGFLAITYISDGKYALAEGLILLAVIADGLDGIVARRFGGGKAKMGDFLDIMADYLSFCVAPAILFYQVYFNVAATPFGTAPSDVLVGVAAGAFMTFGLLRLARHVAVQGPAEGRFQGLPTTGAGFFLTMLVVVGGLGDVLTSLLVLGAAWLMVSDIRYPKVRGNAALSSGVLVLQGAVVLFLLPASALVWQGSTDAALAGASLYVVSGIALTLFRVRLDEAPENDGPASPGTEAGPAAATLGALQAKVSEIPAVTDEQKRRRAEMEALVQRMAEREERLRVMKERLAGDVPRNDKRRERRLSAIERRELELSEREAELRTREEALARDRHDVNALEEHVAEQSAGPKVQRALVRAPKEAPLPKKAKRAGRRSDDSQEVDPDA